ncbi:hypothetical protein H0H92_009665 [Tricholoma furcatifolium]|nr:hypothetical protein H0H92_009665 [Tricholoma furcatifolium]
MNMSQTGYKQRKHIGKALKAQLQAIRTALDQYNAAANLLSPPRPSLTWDEVVDYTFLADFDLLHECQQNISERPWARPAARVLLDRFFKIERAREEIKRLNVEIKHVVTHMRDEEDFLLAKKEELAIAQPDLAYREQQTQYHDIHRKQFQKLAQHPNFMGSLSPGKPLDGTLVDSAPSRMNVDGRLAPFWPEMPRDLSAEDERVEEDDGDSGGDINTLAEILDAIALTSSMW